MSWIVYALSTAVALAAADFFIKIAAGKLSNSLALLLYGSCTFASGLGWVLWQRWQGVSQYAETTGVLAALGVGVSFSLVTWGLYVTFAAGAPISGASPVVRLGGLLLASLAGITLFREPITARYVTGVLMAAAGIYLIVQR